MGLNQNNLFAFLLLLKMKFKRSIFFFFFLKFQNAKLFFSDLLLFIFFFKKKEMNFINADLLWIIGVITLMLSFISIIIFYVRSTFSSMPIFIKDFKTARLVLASHKMDPSPKRLNDPRSKDAFLNRMFKLMLLYNEQEDHARFVYDYYYVILN